MSALSEALEQFDLDEPGFLNDPYPVLAKLREAAPIFWHEPTNQWMVTRHAEVHSVLRDRRLGRVYSHRFTNEALGRPEPDPRWNDFVEHERWSLLQLEPPDHTRIRSLIARAFTPKSVTDLTPFMQRSAAELLTRCRTQETFDLIADFAQPYSIAVICELLGVPVTDADQMLDWSHSIVRMYELNATDDDRERATRAARDFMTYGRSMIAGLRTSGGTGLAARLVAAEENGARLSDDEILCTVIVLLNAGHEATVNTLGNGVRSLLKHRDQWLRLTNREVAAATAVEELLRWDPPLQLFERWVLDPGVEIAEQPVAVGSEVTVLFGAANRDPRQFNEPDRFDVGRGDATHVSFGGGIHFCVGAPLARLELAVALDTLVRECPQLTIAEEPVFHHAFVIHGLTSLYVR